MEIVEAKELQWIGYVITMVSERKPNDGSQYGRPEEGKWRGKSSVLLYLRREELENGWIVPPCDGKMGRYAIKICTAVRQPITRPLSTFIANISLMHVDMLTSFYGCIHNNKIYT